ncbi:threonine/serine exporter family protein [Macrococcus bovicus]|uniref:threonine/serine exporter family protein n=1 Tax=Macrococcus bovicus TaxID=69968 RepID=UPI0025A62592|nr:threonine/serine exporter family protein [Macrococcus bovicus]WJP97276.1 threonine/serine exporter family protein [Macrococcus bovicus]
MDILLNFIFSFIASYCFAVLFDSPRRLFVPSGCVGAAAWMTSEMMIHHFHMPDIYGYFLGSLMLGLMCHTMARLYLEPAMLFMIPGIIPLVPGGLAYDATMKMMLNQTDKPVEILMEITMLAGAIAIGLLFSDYVFRLITKKKISDY